MRLQFTGLLILLALGAWGCRDGQPLANEATALEPSLDFTLPDVGPNGHPVGGESQPGPRPGPDRATYDLPIEEDVPPSQIFDARTTVGFADGFAYSFGKHDYSGNVGTVETTATVSYNGAHLADATAQRRAYIPFLTDFGRVKMVWAEAKVYTDHECGLRVGGHSQHGASWEFYQGTDVNTWGESTASTRGEPASQSACERQTGQTDVTVPKPGGLVCTYLITYDMTTGEWLRAELLYCTAVGGELL